MDTPTPDDIASDVQQRSDTQLKRGLASRHMQMIAIGGAIGTGLFLASGATVANAGPGGALLAYAAIGLMVLLLMQSLGEMSALVPDLRDEVHFPVLWLRDGLELLVQLGGDGCRGPGGIRPRDGLLVPIGALVDMGSGVPGHRRGTQRPVGARLW